MNISDKILKSKVDIKESQRLNVTTELYRYCEQLKERANDRAFLMTIPINIVAANESFFKETFSALINCHPKYLKNSKAIIKRIGIKIELEDISHIEKSSFTLGDIVAYALKYSSIESILKSFEDITELDLFNNTAELQNLMSGYDLEFDDRTLNKDRIVKNLKEVYEIRNIISHDFLSASHKLELNCEQITDYLLDAIQLQGAVIAFCSAKIYEVIIPDDQLYLNNVLKEKEEELSKLYAQIKQSDERLGQNDNLGKSIRAFEHYLIADVQCFYPLQHEEDYPFDDLIVKHKIKLIEQRIKHISDKIKTSC